MNFTINGYDHDGVLLNLSGYRDADECVITRVTAADSQIDIIDIFQISTLCSMGECVDARLSRDAKDENAIAIIERATLYAADKKALKGWTLRSADCVPTWVRK